MLSSFFAFEDAVFDLAAGFLAVCFTEDVEGDYLMLGNKKYIACDPTYIGADIGMSMPSMRKYEPVVITF